MNTHGENPAATTHARGVVPAARECLRVTIRVIDAAPCGHALLDLAAWCAAPALALLKKLPLRTAISRARWKVAWICRDRLAEPRWRRRVRVDDWPEGVGHDGPLVVATVHLGPMELISWALAAQRKTVAVASLDAERRSARFRQASDSAPLLLSSRKPRELAAFVAAGGALVIAVDFPHGKQHTAGGVRLATGAARLAVMHDAPLLLALAEPAPGGTVRITLTPARLPGDDATVQVVCERLGPLVAAAAAKFPDESDVSLREALREGGR